MSDKMYEVTVVYTTADGLTATEEAILTEGALNQPPLSLFRDIKGDSTKARQYGYCKKEGTRLYYSEMFR